MIFRENRRALCGSISGATVSPSSLRRRQGGRPAIPHRITVKVIWFVLVTGSRWEGVPLELDCSGRTAHRRLQRWYARGIWKRLHLHFLTILRKAGVCEAQLAVIDSVLVRAFGGGDATGPSPVDRRKLGSKHTLLADANGVPLVIHTAPANASDYKLILPVVEDFPEIGGKLGLPVISWSERSFFSS